MSTRFSLSMEVSRLARNGIAKPVSQDQILRRERGQDILSFPVQLTTSRIVNLTRLIHTLAIYVTIISGRNPPLLCTLTLIAIQGHHMKQTRNNVQGNLPLIFTEEQNYFGV